MLTIATSFMMWTEKMFWDSIPRKFISMRNEFYKIDNQKTKLILTAINPSIEFNDDKSEMQGVYIDQIGF
jgi:hypothetical protein